MEQHSLDALAAEGAGSGWTAEEAQAYQALCSFGSWALLTDIQEGDVARMAQNRALFSEPPFSQVASEAAGELQAWLAGADAPEGARDLAREAHLDRSYLFYMVGQSRTSPYESVYRTDDATMFGPTTFKVRERYAECGLVFEGNAKEPDDHLGLELAFLAHLLERAAGGSVGEGVEDCKSVDSEKGADSGAESVSSAGDGTLNVSQQQALEQAKSFLSEHVLVFAPLYLANVRKQAHSPFYCAIAAMVAATLESLAAALGACAVETVDEARFSLRD